MLKTDIEKPDVKILASGSTSELLDDLCQIINGLYRQISKSDAFLGEAWKLLLQRVVVDEDGPLWDMFPRSEEEAISMIVPKKKKRS